MELSVNAQAVAYLVSAILFILALKGLTHPCLLYTSDAADDN